jgi:hypothetical protein
MTGDLGKSLAYFLTRALLPKTACIGPFGPATARRAKVGGPKDGDITSNNVALCLENLSPFAPSFFLSRAFYSIRDQKQLRSSRTLPLHLSNFVVEIKLLV